MATDKDEFFAEKRKAVVTYHLLKGYGNFG